MATKKQKADPLPEQMAAFERVLRANILPEGKIVAVGVILYGPAETHVLAEQVGITKGECALGRDSLVAAHLAEARNDDRVVLKREVYE